MASFKLRIKPHLLLVTQLCPTFCDSMDDSPPSSFGELHGVLQVRTLERVVIPFSSVGGMAGTTRLALEESGC